MAETALLEWLRRRAWPTAAVPIPIGDDMAGVAVDEGLILVGIDQVLQGVHFDLGHHGLADAGRKAMNRNLSDCAAMACEPVAALLALALPRGSGTGAAWQIIEAAQQAGARFGCELVGGDTGSWDGPLAITVAIVGAARGIRPVRRDGARAGDALYVTGPLGGSILGRHLHFEPRVRLARELAGAFELHAMIDLSDGLSRDLPRLCEASGVGATLDAELIPVHADARRLGGDAVEHAVNDGEDHELLIAARPGLSHPMLTSVGRIDDVPGVRLRRAGMVSPLNPGGWEHTL